MAFEKITNYGITELPQEYTCESTDTKPVEVPNSLGVMIPVVKHSTCWEYDTKLGFIFDGAAWRGV
jgi:hypothetical protein